VGSDPPKTIVFKGDQVRGTLPSEGKYSRRHHVVIFYGMLKIPADYDSDTSAAKLMDISHQVSSCFAIRCIYWFLSEIFGG
jgi:hypothetical protein